MKISIRAAVPVSAVALLLAGCGGGSDATTAAPSASATPSVVATTSAATPSPSATTASTQPVGATKPKGFTLVVDKKNGYQIALPSGFVRISKKSDLAKVFKAGNKALSEKGLAAQLDNKTLKMLAVNGSTGNAINVVVTGAGGVTADQLPQMQDVLKQQVKQLGASDIKFTMASLGGLPANRMTYQVKIAGRKLTAVQYITVSDDSVFTLTFTEPVKISAKVENQTIGSWRFR